MVAASRPGASVAVARRAKGDAVAKAAAVVVAAVVAAVVVVVVVVIVVVVTSVPISFSILFPDASRSESSSPASNWPAPSATTRITLSLSSS